MKEREAFENEREFLDFARSYLSEAFPNPERTGCPPGDALRLLATRPMQSDASLGDHVTCCSPCFKAYAAYLAQVKAEVVQHQRSHRMSWIRRSAAALAFAAIIGLAAYILVTKRRTEPIIAPQTPAPVTSPGRPDQTQTGVMYVPVVIDLSNASPRRGSELGTARSVRQVIPSSSPVELTLRLPLGSEARLYSVTLRSEKHVAWSESIQAHRQNGDTLLRAPVDFSRIPTGNYELQVASKGRRLTVLVLIKPIPPEEKRPKP